MELHKSLLIDKNKYNISLKENHFNYFAKAKDFVADNYSEDYNRIADTKFNEITLDFFLREMTWCICVSGFNSKIVSKFFPQLLAVLDPMFTDITNGEWQYWADHSWTLDKPLLKIFNNRRKIDAITFNTIELISRGSKGGKWKLYRDSELSSPEKLEKLKMVGPAISKHLARNIGLLDFVKPDIHLKRLAANWGFGSPDELCSAIQKEHNLPLGMIDLILFYTASSFGTKELL